jgi:uncharacterized protein (TIGR03000 family)
MDCRVSSRRAVYAAALLLLAAPPSWGQAPPAEGRPATLIVRLRGDATLEVDDTPTKQTGETRKFVTPPLQPGTRYSYTMVAKWEPNNYTKITRTRKVYMRSGEEIQVDLRTPDPKQPDNIVIRYVPTPQEVVEAMMKLGKVGKDDVVYDLGCGDGRMVLTAVSKFNAKRGVGVDLDPQRLKECEENAKKAGVGDRVEFRQGNVLKIDDLSDATVVVLYMSDELNLALRPRLLKLLKPGSRIVSHRFIMGDWKPDKTETIKHEGEEYLIHLWTVPKM